MSKHFCCCLSLKTGAAIMCFLSLFEGFVEIFSAIIELSDLEDKEKFENITKPDYVAKMCKGITNKECNETAIQKYLPAKEPGLQGGVTLYVSCLLVGLFSIFNGVLLLAGILKAKEKYILLYVLLGSVALFIVIIYSGMNMFYNLLLLFFFILSLFMCYGQLAVYHFYEEVAEYNTVKSGVIEIAYNGEAKSYINSGISADESFDNTAV